MALNISSGTATGGAEQTLDETSGDASWILFVDLSTLVDGDTLVLRAKAVGTGGTYRTIDAATLLGGQLGAIGIKAFGPHTHSLGIRYTLEQPLGTGKTLDWRIESV